MNMLMSGAILLHLMSALIWVGGMFFAYLCLRPVAASMLTPELRLPLWSQVFKRFFPWVWLAIISLPLTGHAMVWMFGGMQVVDWHIHLMMLSGYAMIAIFLHVYFAPYKRLNAAVAASDWPAAGSQLNQIRRLIGINLSLGLLTAAVAAFGRYAY